jgi:hypothetical protein
MNAQQLQFNNSKVFDVISNYTLVLEKVSISNEILTKKQKNFIDKALLSIENEGVISHQSVMNETKNRYPHLFNR